MKKSREFTAAKAFGETKFPDVTNWVGAIGRDIGVAFRYTRMFATSCVPSWQAL